MNWGLAVTSPKTQSFQDVFIDELSTQCTYNYSIKISIFQQHFMMKIQSKVLETEEM